MEIATRNLGVSIAGKAIIKNISLDLKNGEFVGLIGPNGSGKTTILRTIYRALEKTEGSIFFDGAAIEDIDLQTIAQKLGVMRQMSQLSFEFKVIDLVLFGRTPYKKQMELDNAEDYAIVRAVISGLGLDDLAERNYNELSGGEQQRVMMAMVLAGTPQALLLDEMTNHLDIYYQFRLLDIVKELKIAVLAVMHDLNLAAAYCDKIYCLKEGEIIAHGRTEDVLTPEIIEKAFRVRASVIRNDAGKIHIICQSVSK